MSEATSALKFQDIITRIAREAGNAYHGSEGTEKAMPPIHIPDLELAKEIANEGIKMFIADAPLYGWRWRHRILALQLTGVAIEGTADDGGDVILVDAALSATYEDGDLIGYYIYITSGTGKGSYAKITNYTEALGTITVDDWLDEYGNAGGDNPAIGDTYIITGAETVGGDITRYPLPENFAGEISGPIEYAAGTAINTKISWSSEAQIRASQQNYVASGYPTLAAIRPWEPKSGTLGPTRRSELILNYKPAGNYVVEFPYIVEFDKLDLETGLADTGGDGELVDAERTEGDDYFVGWKIEIISGAGKGSWAIVTDYTGDGGTFAVADWLKASGAEEGTNPGENSVYIVEPKNNLHPAGQRFDRAILSAVLFELEMRDSSVRERQPGFVEVYTKKDLLKAYQIDSRSALYIDINKKRAVKRHYREGEEINIENINGRF